MENIVNKKWFISGPFFNKEQIDRIERIKKIFESFNIKYFSPKDMCILSPSASAEERAKVFLKDINELRKTEIDLVITDGKDMGTLFEAGFSFANKIPIVYFCETLKNSNFNLMLAQSGIKVCKSEQELIDFIKTGKEIKYTGNVE